MPKIIQLDRHVADLIAAGEVVERPASAVKELVENSIDAGAKNITIELQNGGMTFLRITDDGCGMEPVDARTAFLRHATSKIRKKEDLACIGTLGFRGEALAAISSVSKIDLLTRAQGAENGVRLHLEAGQVLSEEPAGCPCGTTILVRELFYNTPARMKFMKSDAAESSAVFSVVQQQALAHPEISFRFLKDGQEQLHTDGQGDRMAAIYAIYGRELANNMLPVDGSWEKLRVRGFVTKPTATRGNRAWQSFFVNNRYIKSRLLSAALEEAYRNQIMVGRFPACVLEIDMPVQAVDVNVHPAKTEVKFLSEREVFDAVHYAVLSTLSRAAGRPEWKTPEKKQEAAPQPQSHPKAVQPPKPGFYQTMQASEYRRQAAQQPVQKPAQPVLASPVQLPRSEPVPAQQSFPLPKPEESRRSDRSRSPNRRLRSGPSRSRNPSKSRKHSRRFLSRKSPSASSVRRCTPISLSSRARPFCSSTSTPRTSVSALRRSKRRTTPSWPSCCWPLFPQNFHGKRPLPCWKTGRFWSAAGSRRRTSAAETCSSGRSRPTWTWRTQRRFCRSWRAICWPEKRSTRTACATICCTPSPANRPSRPDGRHLMRSCGGSCRRFCPATISNTARMAVPSA